MNAVKYSVIVGVVVVAVVVGVFGLVSDAFIVFVSYVCFSFPKVRGLRVFPFFAFNNFLGWLFRLLSWYSVVGTSAKCWSW